MGLVLRGNQNEKLSIENMDDNFLYLEELALVAGVQGPQGPAGSNGPQGPTGPAGAGVENTFTMPAHPSLTLADVGKWVMTYSDADFEDFVMNVGPTTSLSSYTGVQGVAKVVELTGASDGSPGEWILDLSQSYGGTDWETLTRNNANRIFSISAGKAEQFLVRNLNFQPSDPYLSSIIDSIEYINISWPFGTYSFPATQESAAIMIEYYANNGFPDSSYTAEGSFGAAFPYHITLTQSYWTSATRNGTELTLKLDPNSNLLGGNTFVSVQFFDSFVEPDVNIEFSRPDTLEFPVLGILQNVNDGVATISEIPEIYEFVVNEGIPIESGTSSFIYTLPYDINNEKSYYGNTWVVKEGGEGLVNLLVLLSEFEENEELVFTFLASSPIYTPLYSGEVGTSIKFKKTSFFSGR